METLDQKIARLEAELKQARQQRASQGRAASGRRMLMDNAEHIAKIEAARDRYNASRADALPADIKSDPAVFKVYRQRRKKFDRQSSLAAARAFMMEQSL